MSTSARHELTEVREIGHAPFVCFSVVLMVAARAPCDLPHRA
jgi:hypothetical protein